MSRGSEDSGVTSLSASNGDLRTAAAEAKALMEFGVQDKEGQEQSLSTSSNLVEEKDEGELSKVEAGPLQPSRPKLLDFSVLKDSAFIWYSLFGLFATLGFFAPQLYIIELSKNRGVEPSMASYMLSVMAVAEIFGRLSIGMVLNKVCCRKTWCCWPVWFCCAWCWWPSLSCGSSGALWCAAPSMATSWAL